MATKILDPCSLKALQPALSLWRRYRPEAAPHRFSARTAAEARQWQRATRKGSRSHSHARRR